MLSWGNYWKENPKLFVKVMEKSTQFFAHKLIQYKIITPNTTLLDFGCGPGYLANELKGKLTAYYGVDISSNYIETARKKCADASNFTFKEILLESGVDGLLTAVETGKQFNTIIVLSVVQYFKNKEEVIHLLHNCKLLLVPAGKIILADVIEDDKGLWKDAFSVLIDSIQHFYLPSFIRFMFRVKLSKYNTLRKEHQLLHLSKDEVIAMGEKLQLNVAILPTITLQSSRISYCLSI